MIVRIPNEYIRKKVLEKRLWYVGTAMFHVSPWSATQAPTTPELLSIPLWAHLKGVPLSLRSQEGLSLAAVLVGEPKETDEYTKNLTNIEVAHVKVDADLTKELPPLVQIKRQSGEIIQVQVEYPWVPPSCSLCHQIGHIIKDFLRYDPKWVPAESASAKKDPNQQGATNTGNKEVEQTITVGANIASTDLNKNTIAEQNLTPLIVQHSAPPFEFTSAPPPCSSSSTLPPLKPTIPFPTVVQPSPSTPSPINLFPIEEVFVSDSTLPLALSTDPHKVSLAIALPAQNLPRKLLYPSKHKPNLKRPFISASHSSLLAQNPFAILLSSPKKSLKLASDSDQNHPPIDPDPNSLPNLFAATPSVGPLLIQGVPPESSL